MTLLIESGAVTHRTENSHIEQKQYREMPLIGATAFALARQKMERAFDYLFIDEAGQVALGNLVAAGQCAKNIVLIGDQMQLGQPIQGCASRRERSIVPRLFARTANPPFRASLAFFSLLRAECIRIFAAFISEAIYENRLKAHSRPTARATHCSRGPNSKVITKGERASFGCRCDTPLSLAVVRRGSRVASLKSFASSKAVRSSLATKTSPSHARGHSVRRTVQRASAQAS